MLSLTAIAFGLIASASAAPVATPELPDLVEKILPSVVNISSITISEMSVQGMEEFFQFWGLPRDRKQTSLGSGFILDTEGYILTNNHVVDRATEVEVTLNDKRKFRARIVGKDPKLDLALLQIRDKDRKVPEKLVATRLADSNSVRIAEPVLAIGNPFGLQHTVTMGIISAKNRTIGMGPFDNFLQTDAAINPGNSGGPLFNIKGEVIGVNTVIYSRTGQSGGLGFAIPINEAKQILPDLKQFGRVPRPWLGVLGERVSPQLAAYYRLPRQDGVLIYNLVEAGPADEAGIHQGDIVIEANGQSTVEVLDLERVVTKAKPKDILTLIVQRGTKKFPVKVKLSEHPPRMDRLPQGII